MLLERVGGGGGGSFRKPTFREEDLQSDRDGVFWRRVRSLGEPLLKERPGVAVPAAFLRITSGLIFVVFGLGKFVSHASEARSFARYGLPWPGVFASAIGGLELVLGLLLLVGLATRLVALILAGDMIGAIATAGRVEGGAINLGLAPALLVVMLFLIWAGAGRRSLDDRLRRSLSARSTKQGA